MITCNAAQYYGITQSSLDEICRKINVVPVPDYERFFTNLYGDLFILNITNGISLDRIKPYKIDKNTNVCTYSIYNMNDEIEDITNVELCARTYYGYFPYEYIYLKNNEFIDNSSILYRIDQYEHITDDSILINGIIFKRIYYEGTIWTYDFISNKGVAFNDLKKKIFPHTFQHNMYHRHPIAVNHHQKRIGTHRLVYNVWSGRWVSSEFPINHIDGFKYHNIIDNLEETTHLANFRHAQLTGLRDMPYSNEFIHTLCSLLESNKYKPREMQLLMGVPDDKYSAFRNLIKSITMRGGWRDISKNYNLDNYKNTRHDGLSDDKVREICEFYINNNRNLKAVYNHYSDMSHSGLAALCRGQSHKEITSQYNLGPKKTHISRDIARKIRDMIKEGFTDNEICNSLAVLPDSVSAIRYKDELQAKKCN